LKLIVTAVPANQCKRGRWHL